MNSTEAQQDSTGTIYSPLNTARNEIRLLEIRPRHSDDAQQQPTLRLSVHSLDDAPVYQALSYVWGDPKQTKPVTVDGHQTPVTTNLFDALLQLREQGVQTIWADAVCINQQDDEEKAIQIQMMATIYSRAVSVVAWLGCSDASTERALQNIRSLYRMTCSFSLDLAIHDRPNLWTWQRDELEYAGETLALNLCDDLSFERGDIGSIMPFLLRPYWSRLWVIQELCLAKKALLLCGRHMISWEVYKVAGVALGLLRGYGMCHQTRTRLLDLYGSFERELTTWGGTAAVTISARVRVMPLATMSMWDALESTCNSTKLEATDPRDRIYALHGLLAKEDQDAVTVDLSVSWVDLYRQATLHMLAQFGPRLFEFCGSAYASHELPTWTVNWSCTQTRPALSDDPARRLTVPYRFRTVGHDKIALRAAVVGKVTAIVPRSRPGSGSLGQIFEHLCENYAFHLATSWPDPQATILECLLRTGSWTLEKNMEVLNLLNCPMSQEEKVKILQDMDTEQPASPQSNMDIGLQDGTETAKAARKSPNDVPEELELPKDQLWKSILITDTGYIGWVEPLVSILEGDVLHAFPEYRRPCLLRHTEGDSAVGFWSFSGTALVPGLMEFGLEGEDRWFNLNKFWESDPVIEEIVLG